jgi:hypothetical protein
VSLNPTVRALTVRLNSHSSHNWANHSIKYECTSLQSQQSGHHCLISHTWTDWSSHLTTTIVCARENLMHDTVQIRVGHSACLSVYRHSKLIRFLNPKAFASTSRMLLAYSKVLNVVVSAWHYRPCTNAERKAEQSLQKKWCIPTLCLAQCQVWHRQTQSQRVHCLSFDPCVNIDRKLQIVKRTYCRPLSALRQHYYRTFVLDLRAVRLQVVVIAVALTWKSTRLQVDSFTSQGNDPLPSCHSHAHSTFNCSLMTSLASQFHLCPLKVIRQESTKS